MVCAHFTLSEPSLVLPVLFSSKPDVWGTLLSGTGLKGWDASPGQRIPVWIIDYQ